METRYKKTLNAPIMCDSCTQTMLSIHPDEPLFINKRKANTNENSEYTITENTSLKKYKNKEDEHEKQKHCNITTEEDNDYIPPSNYDEEREDDNLSDMSFIVDDDYSEDDDDYSEDDDDYSEDDDEYVPNEHDLKNDKKSKKNTIVIPIKIPISFENDVEEENGDESSDDESSDDENIEEKDKIAKDIKKTYEAKLSKDEKIYFRSLDDSEKEKLIDSEDKISEINFTKVPLRFKILNSAFDSQTKAIALSKINMMNKLDSSNGEKMKLINYVESLCKIPIGTYKKLPVDSTSSKEDIFEFISKTYSFFNNKIYGHKDAKEQIIRILAQWIANPQSKGNVIGIHGNPGVGKTTLVKECICNALDIPFQFIPIGGASDSSYIEGHSYTYEGSTWGKIVDSLMKAKCMNPVLYFDELDKVSDTPRGQEIINLLIHITDPSQNDSFYDKYFSDFPVDLSKCLIIFTYNDDTVLNPILKDRMIRISTKGYNNKDKLTISKKYLIPEMFNQFGFRDDEITFKDDIIEHIINKTEKESGVRNLKRSLELIISNVNLTRMINVDNNDGIIGKCFPINNETNTILPIVMTSDIIDNFIKDTTVNESHSHLYL
jgi:ATP-dependent Lon protease